MEFNWVTKQYRPTSSMPIDGRDHQSSGKFMTYNPKVVLAFFETEKLPLPVLEHRFHQSRKWRFDFAWPEQKIALEVEGGLYQGGRHQRINGFKSDLAKYNAASAAGWRVLRCLPAELCTVGTANLLRQALGARAVRPRA
jgi:hypothetical protein